MEILRKFTELYPMLKANMANTHHSTSLLHTNPYHVESSVWAHTCMVYREAVYQERNDIIKVAALLHDIGKCYCYEDLPNNRRRFSGHEGRSFFEAIPIIKQLLPDISSKDLQILLFLIANHGVIYSCNTPEAFLQKMHIFSESTVNKLLNLIAADMAGRISFTEDRFSILEEYAYYYNTNILPTPTELPLPKTMYILIGLPGSGKSTFADHQDANVISRDQFVDELGTGSTYNERWTSVDQNAVDQAFTVTYNTLLRSSEDLIIDKTNLTKRSRRRFVADARQHGYNIVAVVFPTDIYTCAERRSDGDKTVPYYVINNMANKFTFPLGDEVDKTVILTQDQL